MNSMEFSVFIATSADGYIATTDGDVEWLHEAGNPDADMGDNSDMGFGIYIDSVDSMIMGRKCMEMISSFNLTPDQWPYGSTKIFVLSNSVLEAPENLRGKVEMYSGDILGLVSRLEDEGFKHAYVDGGATITSFLNLGLINEMTISIAPILLGEGIPLFGKINKNIRLTNSRAAAFPNEFLQTKYRVNYL